MNAFSIAAIAGIDYWLVEGTVVIPGYSAALYSVAAWLILPSEVNHAVFLGHVKVD